jgi:hypothetical protein
VCLIENEVCCAQQCATLNSVSKILENSIVDTELTYISIQICGVPLLNMVDYRTHLYL